MVIDAPEYALKSTLHQIKNLEFSVIQAIDKAPAQPMLYCLINLIGINALIDTGCSCCCIDEKLAIEADADINPDAGVELKNASNTPMNVVGRTVVEMVTMGVVLQVPCLVIRDSPLRFILSYLFFQTLGCVIDTGNNFIVNWPARLSPECHQVNYKDVAPETLYRVKPPTVMTLVATMPVNMDRKVIAKLSQKSALDAAYRMLNPAFQCDQCGKARFEGHVCVTFKELVSESSDDTGDSSDSFDLETPFGGKFDPNDQLDDNKSTHNPKPVCDSDSSDADSVFAETQAKTL